MHYKRLQKYGKKLAVAVLTSAVLLASGATVYADDTGEYLSQANTQEAEVTESTEDVATPAESESGEVESTTRNQEEQKNKATESELQEEGKIQDVSEEQPESEARCTVPGSSDCGSDADGGSTTSGMESEWRTNLLSG